MKPEIISSTMKNTVNQKQSSKASPSLDKPEKRSLTRSLILTLYITFCYYALLGGDEVKRMICYNKIISDSTKLSELDKRGLIQQKKVEKAPGSYIPVIQYRFSRLYPNMPNMYLLILPGFLVFTLVFTYVHYLRNATLRGFLLLLTFVAICCIFNGLQKKLIIDVLSPNVGVFVTSGFYGALFWLLDNYNYTGSDLRGILMRIKGDNDKLQILYDYTKTCLHLFITLFIGICITFAWQVSTSFEETYGEIGIEMVMTGYTAWLVLCGSIGILGIATRETAARMRSVVESIKYGNDTMKNKSK